MKILIFGLPGSGKTTLAKPFAELIGGLHLNADEVRTRYDDWDFSLEGRIRQAQRMRYLADGVVMAGGIAIADFVCPTEHAREEFAQTLQYGWTLSKKVVSKIQTKCLKHQCGIIIMSVNGLQTRINN